jgi:hypothetical protein
MRPIFDQLAWSLDASIPAVQVDSDAHKIHIVDSICEHIQRSHYDKKKTVGVFHSRHGPVAGHKAVILSPEDTVLKYPK